MNLSNPVRILDAVRKDLPSRKELAGATGIPWGSMCNAVNALLERGLLQEIRRKVSSPGRPSVPLSINADAGFLAGVDVGASKTRILFTDLNFRILFQRSVETERFTTEERFFAWAGGLFEAALGRRRGFRANGSSAPASRCRATWTPRRASSLRAETGA